LRKIYVKKMCQMTSESDDATRSLLLEQLQILSDDIKKPDVKADGAFATRVQFIIEKCREKGVSLSPPAPAAAPARQQSMS